MIIQIKDLFFEVIDQIWSWAQYVYDYFGLSYAGIALAFIMVMALARYLLRPFIGGAMSDGARQIRKGSKKNANNS